ncbi:MAG: hypothetical protein HRU20_06205 [Pseudomonadales bacterium]|nr:hypothetical protein [Pseudomonadales bacterium]
MHCKYRHKHERLKQALLTGIVSRACYYRRFFQTIWIPLWLLSPYLKTA